MRFKYSVLFNLTYKEILNIQREISEELKYSTRCIYFFIEETRRENVSKKVDDDIIRKIEYYYTMTIITSSEPLNKDEFISILDIIPDSTNKKFSKRK